MPVAQVWQFFPTRPVTSDSSRTETVWQVRGTNATAAPYQDEHRTVIVHAIADDGLALDMLDPIVLFDRTHRTGDR